MLRDDGGPLSLRFFAAATLAVFVVATFSVPGASGKEKSEEYTNIYRDPYEKVFLGAQAVLDGMQMNIQTVDKDKGIITGKGKYVRGGAYVTIAFDIRIETVNDNPGTRVTVNAKTNKFNVGFGGGYVKSFKVEFLQNLQQMLANTRHSERPSQ